MPRRATLVALLLAPAFAALGDDVPEPLTYEFALASAANASQPDVAELDAQLGMLRAELGIEQGEDGFSLDLRGRLRRVGPSDVAPPDAGDGDSAASLVLSRPLYDFGRAGSREQQLRQRLQALEWRQMAGIEQRRLEIMARYFDVLNADNEFITANEAMAIGFIRYDNAVEDRELGQVSDIELLEKQTAYENTRQARYLAADNQRLARSRLAAAMGYPGVLSSDLEVPEFSADTPLPDDVEALIERALRHSADARVAAADTRVALAGIAIAENGDNPSLDFEIELSAYEREGATRDDWRASIYFDVPLYSPTSTPTVALARARHRLAMADEQRLRANLRVDVLRLWQEIRQLQLEYQGQTVDRRYRERKLDRSRAEYELEFKTDLGDSMVEFSRSNTRRKQLLYAHELAYQRLATLVGADFLRQLSAPPQ